MSVVNFLKCLTIMDLSLTMKDVKRAAVPYKRWAESAEPFMRKHGILRAFTKISKSFQDAGWEFTEDHGTEFGAELKRITPTVSGDLSVTAEQVALFRDLSLFMRKDSAPAWDRITKNVSILNDHNLSNMFMDSDVHEVADMSIVQSLEKIVTHATGRKQDPILTVNEMRELKETSPKMSLRYSELLKQFKLNYKTNLMKFVRTQGKKIVNVVRAKAYLEAMGCNYLPVGFVGNVDEKGILYTTDGKMLKGTMFGRMAMNPNYDSKTDNTYYAKLVGDMRGELRTVEMLKANKTERMVKVNSFAGDLDSYRKKWIRDLDSLDVATQMIAGIVEIVHLTQARIGGEGNENEGVATYGISTLLRKHVRITQQGVEMRYPGKKGTMQHHKIKPNTVTNRKIIAIVKAAIEGKEKESKVFVAQGLPIKPREVNQYLKSIGVKVTIHKFRHVAATKTAMEMLAQSPFSQRNKPTQAQAERWIKTEAVKIGTMLHHRTGSGDTQKTTSTTAIAAYIDPALIKKFFVDLGLRAPKWLPAFDD